MKARRWCFAVLYLCAANLALAQLDSGPVSTTTELTLRPRGSFVPGPGFLLPAKLTATLDAKSAKVGTPVIFEVTDNVTADGTATGRVLIPAKAKVVGAVVEATTREKGSGESRLSILVDRAEWAGGGSAQLSGYIAQVFKMPEVSVRQKASRDINPNTSDAAEYLSRMNSIHVHVQSDVSPGQLDPCFERGCGVNPFEDGDLRLLALEDVTLQPDPKHGSVLVSPKKNVHLEKWTFLVLRTNGILLAQN